MNSTINKLKSTLALIGKSEYNHNSKVEDFLYDGKEVSSFNKDYFINLNNDFSSFFNLLLGKNKVDKKLIKFLFENTAKFHHQINEKKNQVRVIYVFLNSKGELREGHERTHEIINSMINAQKNALKEIHSMLYELYNNLDYLTDEDIETFRVGVGLEEDESQLIKNSSIGKVTINLSAKDSLSLLLVLEYLGYLDFNNTDKNRFIENNFNYEYNSELIAVNSPISKIFRKESKMVQTNKRSILRLINNLIDSLEDFKFDGFLNSRIK